MIASLANVADTELTWQWYRAGNALVVRLERPTLLSMQIRSADYC
jgi:hypothetical protein